MLGCAAAKERRLIYVAWLVVYIVADDVIGLLPLLLKWNPGQWNWIGQSASLLFSLVVVRLFLENGEVGLRLPRTRPQWSWTLAGILGALAIAVVPALIGSGSRPGLETFAYQATLPGPVEELEFRGIGLALLLRTFTTGKGDRRAPIIAVLVSAVWFTSGHVLHLIDGKLVVVWARFFDVFPMAIWYAVVRLRSASLVGSVLAHNAANTLVEVIAAVRF